MAPTNIFVPGVPSIGKSRRRIFGLTGGGAAPFKSLLGVGTLNAASDLAFSTYSGQAVSTVLAFAYEQTWANLQGWATAEAGRGANYDICWAIGIPYTKAMSDVNAGTEDTQYNTLFDTILAARPSQSTIYLRVLPEFQLSGKPWYSIGSEAAYKSAFQRIVGLARAKSAKFKIIFNPNYTTAGYDPMLSYPGDAYVDVFGQDVYKISVFDGNGAAAWNTRLTETYGLNWLVSTAAAHSKPICIPEWGVDNNADGPFIASMAAWLSANKAVFHCYFDVNNDIYHYNSISNLQYPLVTDAFVTAFGTPTDTSPAAYRTTTQTMVAGRTQTCDVDVIPPLGAEFAINTWWRDVSTVEGFLFNLHEPTAAQGAASIGGTTLQALSLYFSGLSIATLSLQNLFFLTGIDKAGNKLNASTVAVNTWGSAYGVTSTETQVNNGSTAALITVQYRAGNMELWITYRGMAPRKIISQACTWTGTSKSLQFRIGGSNTTINSSGSMEFEMPIVMPNRSMSQNEIAQLSNGVSPEKINFAGEKASASIKFAIVTDGTTTVADRADAACPVDGNTLTLNGAVYTFRTSPSLTSELKTYTDITINQAVATDGTFTFASAPPIFPVNGQHVSLHKSTMPSAIDARLPYYVVNANSGALTYQLSLTPGGAALTFSAGASSASARLSYVPQMMDDLCTQLNALTANTGGASNATYEAYGSDTLVITARTAGAPSVSFPSFTFDCNATNVKFPTNKRLALAWAYITDYTGFKVGLFGSAGGIRRRSSAWVTPPGTALAPNSQVTGAMLINSWTDGMVTNSVGGTSSLALSGLYTGIAPPSGAQLKLYDQNGNTQIHDFTSLTAFTVNTTNRTWTGKITEAAAKKWSSLQVRKTGSTQVHAQSELRFGFGYVVLAHGRSHQTDWFNDFASNDVAPNGFISQFNGTGMTAGANGSFPIDNTWHVYGGATTAGAGSVAFGNKVSNTNSVCLAYISRAIGGVSFATLTDPTVWAAYQADLATTWADTSLMSPAAAMIWTHSAEDYGTVSTGLLSQLRTMLTSYISANCKLGVTTSLTAGDSADGTQLTGRVRGQQIDYKVDRLSANDTSVFDAGDYSYNRLNTADGIHSSGIIDHKIKCETAAVGFLGALSGTMNAATGPTISSIVRTGANIDITWNLNGATALQIPNVGTSLRGFDVALTSSSFLPIIRNPTASSATSKFTDAGHGWNNGDPVIVTNNSGSQPGGITAGVKYFIVNATTNDYQLSATVGGSAITLTTNGASLYAYNCRALLTQTSHTITGANTTRIVLASDPGASVMVRYLYGRPGRQNAGSFDPTPALDLTGETAMTDLWGPTAPAGAQGNFLNDNFSRTYTGTTTIGRLARMTSTPITVS
jgi:hypothetical protein